MDIVTIAPLDKIGIDPLIAALPKADLHVHQEQSPRLDRVLARDHLIAESKADRVGLDGEVGFVVLHRCENDFYFLIVSTWRGNNELWESVYYKQDAATPGFSLFPREGRHKGAYCVWELGPVWHEQQAWVRFLTSSRDAAAQQAYLDDRFAGSVG